MALSEGNVILATDFIAIKARVKAECARRKYNGSVESYAGSSYDYTVTPTEGDVPLPEHFNKIIVPMNAIVNIGRTQTQNGYLVRAMSDIDAALTTLEGISETASNGGCKASCTGLCQGTCTTGCTGCSNTCKDGCKGSCVGGCGYECSNDCTDECASECRSECGGGCGGGCTDSCTSSCIGTCSGGCGTGCKGNCSGSVLSNPT